MNSLILQTASRFLVVLLAVFALFALVRGHHEPGGGFIGGLLAATAFTLHAQAFGARAARRLLRVDPRTLMGVGLLVATAAGLIGLLHGAPLLTGVWLAQAVPALGKLGTPLLFDLGVFLVVWGTVLHILLALAEE
jgi:multicomponent Na+:H+ antiporter subunit B